MRILFTQWGRKILYKTGKHKDTLTWMSFEGESELRMKDPVFGFLIF